jgi:hypothetical protein
VKRKVPAKDLFNQRQELLSFFALIQCVKNDVYVPEAREHSMEGGHKNLRIWLVLPIMAVGVEGVQRFGPGSTMGRDLRNQRSDEVVMALLLRIIKIKIEI